MSNAIPPSVTPPSPNEWPQNLIKPISGISKNIQATVTSTSHGFTTQDQGVTFLMIKRVEGMIQINGMNCLIQTVLDSDHFSINIDTTDFYVYRSGGVAIVDSMLPPVQQASFQYFNTPFQNIANGSP